MKYNDNGEYKDIYVKSFDTLPVGAIVEYSGSTIPDGWTDIGNNQIQKTSQYIEGGASLSNVYGTSNENGYTQEYINGLTAVENGTLPVTNTTQASGSIRYDKIGRMVQITYDLKLTQTVSGTWKSVLLLTLPDFLKPIYSVLISIVRDSSTSTIIGLGISSISGNLYFTDRGRGNLLSSNESFNGTLTYITAE